MEEKEKERKLQKEKEKKEKEANQFKSLFKDKNKSHPSYIPDSFLYKSKTYKIKQNNNNSVSVHNHSNIITNINNIDDPVLPKLAKFSFNNNNNNKKQNLQKYRITSAYEYFSQKNHLSSSFRPQSELQSKEKFFPIQNQKNYSIEHKNKNNLPEYFEYYSYIVRPENCGYLICKCFEHRKNWIKLTDMNSSYFNFKWQQNNKNIDFISLSKINGYKQIVNHFENHSVLTNKSNLFVSLLKYAEVRDINIFKYLPFTALFEYNNDKFFEKIEKFEYLFNNIEKYVVDLKDINDHKYKNNKMRLYNEFLHF